MAGRLSPIFNPEVRRAKRPRVAEAQRQVDAFMKLLIKIPGIICFLIFSGLLVASLSIILHRLVERFKFWVDHYPFRNTLSRGFLFWIVLLFVAIPLLYGLFIWVKAIIWFVRGEMYPLFLMLIGIFYFFAIFFLINKRAILRRDIINQFFQPIPYLGIVILRLSVLCLLPLFAAIASFWIISEINPFGFGGEGWWGGNLCLFWH